MTRPKNFAPVTGDPQPIKASPGQRFFPKLTTGAAFPQVTDGMAPRPFDPKEALAVAVSTISTAELAALARGEVDGFDCITSELARRGVDHSGAWVGFELADQIRAGAMVARDQAIADSSRTGSMPEALAKSIAESLGVRVLQARNRDSLDFHEVHVDALMAALNRAWRGACCASPIRSAQL